MLSAPAIEPLYVDFHSLHKSATVPTAFAPISTPLVNPLVCGCALLIRQ